jgi:20S proteasome subunit beta 2
MVFFFYDDDYSMWRNFNFVNFWRNEEKFSKKLNFFQLKKTGTTICGLLYKKGIILGSDTRATNGDLVCDINCEKIHFISPNICCGGAGTSADIENITKLLSNQLELIRVSTGKESRVKSSISICQKILYTHKGFLSAALIVGGLDFNGSQLYAVYPHGSSEKVSFVSLGSGSLAATSILDNNFKKNLTFNQALLVLQESIKAGIYNDTGSGGSIDLCIITKKRIKFLRNKFSANKSINTTLFCF